MGVYAFAVTVPSVYSWDSDGLRKRTSGTLGIAGLGIWHCVI